VRMQHAPAPPHQAPGERRRTAALIIVGSGAPALLHRRAPEPRSSRQHQQGRIRIIRYFDVLCH